MYARCGQRGLPAPVWTHWIGFDFVSQHAGMGLVEVFNCNCYTDYTVKQMTRLSTRLGWAMHRSSLSDIFCEDSQKISYSICCFLLIYTENKRSFSLFSVVGDIDPVTVNRFRWICHRPHRRSQLAGGERRTSTGAVSTGSTGLHRQDESKNAVLYITTNYRRPNPTE